MMDDAIKKLYLEWTAGEEDDPFTKTERWRGDMVLGFVKFCLEQQVKKFIVGRKEWSEDR